MRPEYFFMLKWIRPDVKHIFNNSSVITIGLQEISDEPGWTHNMIGTVQRFKEFLLTAADLPGNGSAVNDHNKLLPSNFSKTAADWCQIKFKGRAIQRQNSDAVLTTVTGDGP